jgi:4-hydroxy-3-methylbut-2-enyl diphosphate reductase IspH
MHVRYANIQKLRNTEMLMVIGDEHSNNVNQLVELAKNYKINTVLVNDVQKITIDLFDNINNLVITSGTSVDPKHVQAIVDKIKTIVR